VTGGEVHVIAAGWAHSCVIMPDGGVQCWGNNAYGQLGDGTNNGSTVPVQVVGLTGGTNIVAGANHTCVLAGNAVWCWGQNNKGQIGDGTTTNRNKPVQVLSGVANITAGLDYTCAVMKTGHVMCWGDNENGQLADGTKISHSLPYPARLITGVSDLDGGQNKTCGLNGAGLISCWSGGGAAQTLGPIVPVTGGQPEINTDVAVNRFGSLVVGVDEQGMPVTFQSGQVKLVSSVTGVVDIDSGLLHVCALLRDGTVKCWGSNTYGQLGDSTKISNQTPVSVVDLPAATDMAVGRNHSCVIFGTNIANSGVMCWGLNSDGQLGNGTTTDSAKPVEVLFGE
jgi:alpha-tubulin suppressor-like RCC1 family protein